MVECESDLDLVFGSLASPVRRDILRRGAHEELSIGGMAKSYNLTFAAISKHVKVLERAKLISKRRRGREQLIRLSPVAFADATHYLREYEKLWNNRLDSLEQYLATFPKSHGRRKKP